MGNNEDDADATVAPKRRKRRQSSVRSAAMVEDSDIEDEDPKEDQKTKKPPLHLHDKGLRCWRPGGRGKQKPTGEGPVFVSLRIMLV